MPRTQAQILHDIEVRKKMAHWAIQRATADLEKLISIDWLSREDFGDAKTMGAHDEMLRDAKEDRADADDSLLEALCLEKLINGR